MLHRLVLYGAGKRCKALCSFLKDSNYKVVAILDSDPQKWGSYIEEFTVQAPEKLKQLSDVSVCITIADREQRKIIEREIQKSYHHDIVKEDCLNTLIFGICKEHPQIQQSILRKREKENKTAAVLFDCYDNGLGLGGIEAWTIDICSTLIQSGRENIYIISRRDIYDIPPLLDNYIIYVDKKSEYKFGLENIMCLIESIMEKLPCTVVTAHVDAVMWAAYLIKCYYPDKIKIVSVIHEGNEKTYDRYLDFSECTDIYIGVSQDIKNAMIARGIAAEKVYSMMCPFACEKILIRSYTEENSKPIRIGYAGRLDRLKYSPKRMDLLLKLIEALVKEKILFKMELAGEGPARKDMEDFIYSMHYEDRVVFLGRIERSEISFFWQSQDICINVSDSEGRSISRLEAMANGAVPIVTDTSGTKEDIIDGVNGYVVPIGDYRTMVKKIRYLSEHRKRLREIGQLAHDMVYPKSRMEQHLEFWEEILYKDECI